ncbi:ChbG/HpnK family deacetylase [Ramlibacter sp. G-1-2-2]|uniref:ChbG/HpnK family deacetylase n=1 Tax=Ramlibacter agri TaxID=2728837 RepID=A0A848GWB4_9BURK|nr:ChbG/HpnK family deacetylase [Ramlibacter agri]NML42407.1 ChbG/HpnK family deacetylase [Ramlibacter agri]
MRVLERRIAVCVDDYGLDAGVDEAVLRLAVAGRISATSCMTGAPHWQEGAALLREVAPTRFDAGLHLDLTEHPFDARLRKPLEQWIARSYLGLVPRAALRAEIERQLDAFEQALGRAPAHVDGHQHVHQLPWIRGTLLAVLEARYRGGSRPWLRSTRRTAGEPARKAWLIETLGGRAWARAAADKGYRVNRHLLGVYDFRGGADRYLALLADWLAASTDGDLLMCHPALGTPVTDPIAPARRNEYEVLAGPEFAELLARLGLRVVPFSRMPA